MQPKTGVQDSKFHNFFQFSSLKLSIFKSQQSFHLMIFQETYEMFLRKIIRRKIDNFFKLLENSYNFLSEFKKDQNLISIFQKHGYLRIHPKRPHVNQIRI